MILTEYCSHLQPDVSAHQNRHAIGIVVLPRSTSGLCLTATFAILGGGYIAWQLFGKNVRFTEDGLHKHCCAYSCAKNKDVTLLLGFFGDSVFL